MPSGAPQARWLRSPSCRTKRPSTFRRTAPTLRLHSGQGWSAPGLRRIGIWRPSTIPQLRTRGRSCGSSEPCRPSPGLRALTRRCLVDGRLHRHAVERDDLIRASGRRSLHRVQHAIDRKREALNDAALLARKPQALRAREGVEAQRPGRCIAVISPEAPRRGPAPRSTVPRRSCWGCRTHSMLISSFPNRLPDSALGCVGPE